MPLSHYPSGERKGGFIKMILGAGSSGIAVTTWVEEFQARMRNRSNVGRR